MQYGGVALAGRLAEVDAGWGFGGAVKGIREVWEVAGGMGLVVVVVVG